MNKTWTYHKYPQMLKSHQFSIPIQDLYIVPNTKATSKGMPKDTILFLSIKNKPFQ